MTQIAWLVDLHNVLKCIYGPLIRPLRVCCLGSKSQLQCTLVVAFRDWNDGASL
jgi:hypothetical protein